MLKKYTAFIWLLSALALTGEKKISAIASFRTYQYAMEQALQGQSADTAQKLDTAFSQFPKDTQSEIANYLQEQETENTITNLADHTTTSSRFIKPLGKGIITTIAVLIGARRMASKFLGDGAIAVGFAIFLRPDLSFVLPTAITTGLWALPNELNIRRERQKLSSGIRDIVQKQNNLSGKYTLENKADEWIKKQQEIMNTSSEHQAIFERIATVDLQKL